MGEVSNHQEEARRNYATKPRKLDYRLQLLVAVSILLGLFLVEYPPIFLLGYWSWSGLVHKTITGVLLVLNLIVAQQATKRLGFFRGHPEGRPR